MSVKEGMALTGYCRRQILYLRAGQRGARAEVTRAIIAATRSDDDHSMRGGEARCDPT